MKVRVATLFTELAVGGDENRALAFARHVDRARFDPLVVTLVDPAASDESRSGPMAARFRALDVPLRSLGERPRAQARPLPRALSLGRDGVRAARIVRRLARLLRDERVDVLDARMNYAMFVGLAAARLARTPVVVATEYFNDFWSSPPWRFVARAVFDGMDAIVSDSRWAIDQYRRQLDRPLPHARVIPNGIEPPPSTLARSEARARLGLPLGPSVRVVAQVGRLLPFKGQHDLLAAARQLVSRREDVAFLVCGYPGPDTSYRDRLVAAAEDIVREVPGARGRVVVTSYPGPIGDVWRAVDVHVHASHFDSSPIAIHESMALGLPAVVTSAGGIPELVAADESALVVAPRDVPALVGSIERILDDEALSTRLGAAARARFVARHAPERMARTIEGLFEELLARRGHAMATAAATPRGLSRVAMEG